MKTIDFNCQVPTEQGMALHGDLPDFMHNYLRIFGPRLATRLGIETQQYKDLLEKKDYKTILALFSETSQKNAVPIDQFLSEWPALGLVHGVITHRDNHYTADLVSRFPQHFTGFAQVELKDGSDAAVRQFEEALSVGLKGLFLVPFMDDRYPSDQVYYPLYRLCENLKIPVSIHCSMHYATGRRVDYARPLHLDPVAVDFPDLIIIARLGGWPWVPELVGLAIRHSNLYINLANHRPKYLTLPGAGWESLLHFGQNLLKEKVLFGSTWLDLGMALSEVYNELDQLQIDDEAKACWRYKNAAGLLNLE